MYHKDNITSNIGKNSSALQAMLFTLFVYLKLNKSRHRGLVLGTDHESEKKICHLFFTISLLRCKNHNANQIYVLPV